MKISIINMPWQKGERWGARAGGRMPSLLSGPNRSYLPYPFLLAYTAACLEERGYSVDLLDGVAEGWDKQTFCQRLASGAPDLILAETSTASLEYDLQYLSDLHGQNKQAKIAVFSTHFAALPEDGLASEVVDFVIYGEPEMTMVELVETLAGDRDFSKIDGLGFKTPSGKIQTNPRREPIRDLDALPYPKREGLPLKNYYCPGFPAPVVYMYGSRGCPFHCNFCLWTQTIYEQGQYRMRSETAIVSEMRHVLEKFPEAKSFYFDDDLFIFGKKRALRFAAAIREENLVIPWGMHARADKWDEESLTALRETGLIILKIGIESGNQRIVNELGKRLDLEEAAENLRLAHRLGIKNHIGIIVGMPNETWDTVEQTVQFIRSVPIDSAQISVAEPFPGTNYFDELDERGYLLSRDWSRYSCEKNPVMRTLGLSPDELDEAVIYIKRSVFSKPSMFLRRLSYVKDPRDLISLGRKAIRLMRA